MFSNFNINFKINEYLKVIFFDFINFSKLQLFFELIDCFLEYAFYGV